MEYTMKQNRNSTTLFLFWARYEVSLAVNLDSTVKALVFGSLWTVVDRWLVQTWSVRTVMEVWTSIAGCTDNQQHADVIIIPASR